MKTIMKTMVRCRSLDMAALAAQEAHGKRQDRTSQNRRVRDVAPIVAGGLDLRDLYDAHMNGVKQNTAAKKPVLHFIVRFPPELLKVDAKHFHGDKRERQRMMLRQAVAFINRTHGGDAVFAARLDRDEAGETIADVFAAPRYEKRTKRTKPDEKGATWASATKFGKQLCEKHQDEIQRRHPDAKGKLTGPRHVGIALNIEWRSWFQRTNELELAKKIEKTTAAPDRFEIEAYKEMQDQRADLERAQALNARVRSENDRIADHLDKREARMNHVLRRIKSIYSKIADFVGVSLPKDIDDAAIQLSDAVDEYVRPPAQNEEDQLSM